MPPLFSYSQLTLILPWGWDAWFWTPCSIFLLFSWPWHTLHGYNASYVVLVLLDSTLDCTLCCISILKRLHPFHDASYAILDQHDHMLFDLIKHAFLVIFFSFSNGKLRIFTIYCHCCWAYLLGFLPSYLSLIIPFNWHFLYADHCGLILAWMIMIPLIILRLPFVAFHYHDCVPNSSFLILSRLPFNYHNFDIWGLRSVRIWKWDAAMLCWINAACCSHCNVSPHSSWPSLNHLTNCLWRASYEPHHPHICQPS